MFTVICIDNRNCDPNPELELMNRYTVTQVIPAGTLVHDNNTGLTGRVRHDQYILAEHPLPFAYPCVMFALPDNSPEEEITEDAEFEILGSSLN